MKKYISLFLIELVVAANANVSIALADWYDYYIKYVWPHEQALIENDYGPNASGGGGTASEQAPAYDPKNPSDDEIESIFTGLVKALSAGSETYMFEETPLYYELYRNDLHDRFYYNTDVASKVPKGKGYSTQEVRDTSRYNVIGVKFIYRDQADFVDMIAYETEKRNGNDPLVTSAVQSAESDSSTVKPTADKEATSKEIVHRIMDGLFDDTTDDVEKLWRIFEYLRVTTDYEEYVSFTPYDVFTKRIAHCDSYTATVKLFLDELGLENESIIMDNYYHPDEPGHAANVVKVDGSWYFLDATQGYFLTGIDDTKGSWFLHPTGLAAHNYYPFNQVGNGHPRQNDLIYSIYDGGLDGVTIDVYNDYPDKQFDFVSNYGHGEFYYKYFDVDKMAWKAVISAPQLGIRVEDIDFTEINKVTSRLFTYKDTSGLWGIISMQNNDVKVVEPVYKFIKNIDGSEGFIVRYPDLNLAYVDAFGKAIEKPVYGQPLEYLHD